VLRSEFSQTRNQIAGVRSAVDSLRSARKPWPETWGGILVGVVAALSGFGVAAYTASRAATDGKEARLETHLYDSLKWFEGKTQKRSIGLSVIEGNWRHRFMHDTWRGVLVNQATYLLSVSDQDTDHERQNLERIRVLLERVRLTDADRGALQTSLSRRKPGERKGLPNVDIAPWSALAGAQSLGKPHAAG
jgi:hypothetical protein